MTPPGDGRTSWPVGDADARILDALLDDPGWNGLGHRYLPLRRLVATLRAPATSAERAGEDDAVAMFRAVAASYARPASRRGRRRVWAIAGGAALSAVAATGVAAQSGGLPPAFWRMAFELVQGPGPIEPVFAPADHAPASDRAADVRPGVEASASDGAAAAVTADPDAGARSAAGRAELPMLEGTAVSPEAPTLLAPPTTGTVPAVVTALPPAATSEPSDPPATADAQDEPRSTDPGAQQQEDQQQQTSPPAGQGASQDQGQPQVPARPQAPPPGQDQPGQDQQGQDQQGRGPAQSNRDHTKAPPHPATGPPAAHSPGPPAVPPGQAGPPPAGMADPPGRAVGRPPDPGKADAPGPAKATHGPPDHAAGGAKGP